jgi:phosphomannomutase
VEAVTRAVKDNRADLGVMFNADGSRAAIVDDGGRLISQNRLIALTAAMLLDAQPGSTFVTDSVTSSGLSAFIAEWGGIHYRFKRGYRNVIDEAVRLNAEGIDCPLAIETSGHAAFRDNAFLDDGIYLATRVICEALNRKREGQNVFNLIDDLKEPVESVELRLPLLDPEDPAAGQDVVETLLSYTLDDPGWQVAPDNREGVRITFNLDGGVNNAWFQLRMSVHDPVMVLNAESDVPGGVRRILGALYSLIEDSESLDLEKLKHAVGKD